MPEHHEGESLVDRVYARTAELLAQSGQFTGEDAGAAVELLRSDRINADRFADAVGRFKGTVDEDS